MTANKSIDGLSTRAAKASTKRVTQKTNAHRSTPRPSTRVSSRRSPKTGTNLSPELTIKPTIKTTKSISQKSVPKSPTASPEDFINASSTNIWDTIKLDAESDSTQKNDLNTLHDSNQERAETLPKDDSAKKTSSRSIDFKPKHKSSDDSVADFLKPIQAFDFNEDDGLKESNETVREIRKSTHQDEDDDSFTLDPTPKSRKEEKIAKKLQKTAKKPNKKRRIISIVALIIVLILIGGTVWLVFWGNDIIAKITGGRGNVLDLFSLTSETYEPLKTDSNGRTNILAFGTGGYDMNGEEGGGVHDGAQLTDSIMLISFNQDTGDTAMISLPRDLKGPATCTATGKINEVYWCNGGDGKATPEQEEKAATALMEAIGTILGVDIQYYAHLNWGSVISIVDTLGGITITLDEDILDYDYTGAVYKANTPYTINGAEAVGLARARHGTSGGDFSRGASQQKIIVGIKNRIFEKDLSIGDMLGLVSTLGDNLRTNFSLSEFKTLAHDSQILDFDVMRQISLYPDYMTTGNINGISYVLPKAGVGNYTAIQRFIAEQLSSDPRDYESPTIAIYNASDTNGLAAEEKTKLEKDGYTITIIDNAPAGDYKPGTSIYATTNQKPGTYKLLEDRYNFTPLTAEELPTGIAPNYDFIIILNNKQDQN